MSYSYEIKDFDAGARIGLFKVGSRKLETPNLFPVVNPFQNPISPKEFYDHFKVQAIFTNAYIIYKNREKNPEIMQMGLHQHLNFPGIIATDSGGFQDYMYSGEIKLTPEEIEPFQEKIDSDCPVILDIPVQTTDSYEEAKQKVEITIQRAKDNILRRQRNDTAWFGPIHGSVYPDLLKISSQEMSKLDFGFYAIGGVVKTFIDYRFDLDIEILLNVRKWINPSRPLHMFGLGLPNFFSLAVACGADTFDSAAYILYAKDDRYFTYTGTKDIKDLTELPCNCPICSKYTASEIQKLPKEKRIEIIARHNLYHSFSEIRTIRQAIREGTLWDLVEQRVHMHPKFIKALKRSIDFPDYFDQLLNMNKIKGQKILTPFSFYRPHLRYFRKKIERFKVPSSKSILLCLPELDLPSDKGLSFKYWKDKIKSNPQSEKIQQLIISNSLCIIPIELAEIYPAGQHEGEINLEYKEREKSILIEIFKKFLANQEKQFDSIKIFIPRIFINEYGDEEAFSPKTHLISYLKEAIDENFPEIEIKIIQSLEEL
ncbi:MAG: tRNA guanosine(15) transglycosylase TgtA [Promethearchaeota archaeon]